MAAIYVTSSAPALPDLPAGLSDKTGHLAAYAALGALSIRAFAGGTWDGVVSRALVSGLALAAGYGVADEWHQSFVPDRTASAADWGADLAGALAAAIAAGWWARRVRRGRTRNV
jgi:VanZ family protein